jgi:hypothetical protein
MPIHLNAYEEVNRKWHAAAKLIFGSEVGDLDEYEQWISQRHSPRSAWKSSFSEKEVVYADIAYPENALHADFLEIGLDGKYQELNINEIKDIDSIVRALGERVIYSGNIVLGNSDYIEQSTNITDCFYVYQSERCFQSKYIAHCGQVVKSECIFGSSGIGGSSFCIRPSSDMYCNRCFELSKCDYCSDCYYCHGLSGCRECVFCFGKKSARHCIGNLQLTPEKYRDIKARLVEEMHAELEKRRALPTLYQIFSKDADRKRLKELFSEMPPGPVQEKTDGGFIDKAFAETTKIIFGMPLRNPDGFSSWLSRHTRKQEKCTSCISGKPLVLSDHTDFLLMPKKRLVTLSESSWLSGKAVLAPDEAEGITLANAREALAAVAFFAPDWDMGISRHNPGCSVNIDSTDCYNSILNINSKRCAYNYWARESEHLFGCNSVVASSFCINCFHSLGLSRCLEVDAGRECTGDYFCHNVENVHDSMFCFNAKNKRHAIGNAEIPKEKYIGIKNKVLAELVSELSKSGGISRSIFGLTGH